MLLILGDLFDKLVGRTVKSMVSAAEVKIKRETVGKVEGKINAAQSNAQRRTTGGVNKGIDNLLGKAKGKK